MYKWKKGKSTGGHVTCGIESGRLCKSIGSVSCFWNSETLKLSEFLLLLLLTSAQFKKTQNFLEVRGGIGGGGGGGSLWSNTGSFRFFFSIKRVVVESDTTRVWSCRFVMSSCFFECFFQSGTEIWRSFKHRSFCCKLFRQILVRNKNQCSIRRRLQVVSLSPAALCVAAQGLCARGGFKRQRKHYQWKTFPTKGLDSFWQCLCLFARYQGSDFRRWEDEAKSWIWDVSLSLDTKTKSLQRKLNSC